MARHALAGVLALLLLATPLGTAFAQEMSGANASMNPAGGTMVSGRAWVTPLDGEQVVVTVVVWGLEAGASHANHIHSGTCAGGGPVVYPLTGLTANESGWATASTLVSTTVGAVSSGYYVQAHAGATGGAPISCGDLSAAGMMAEPMPMAGGM
jgi:hypothetical protein